MKKEIGPTDAIDNEAAGCAYVENFALRVFSLADNEDRKGNATRYGPMHIVDRSRSDHRSEQRPRRFWWQPTFSRFSVSSRRRRFRTAYVVISQVITYLKSVRARLTKRFVTQSGKLLI